MSEVASFELPRAQRKRVAALVNGPDGGGPLAVRTDQGEVELPPTARATVRRLLADLAAGIAVHLLTDDTELTTQDPADILSISRTYVVRLVDNRKLPAHLVGTHRRLRPVDVLAYKTRRDARLAGADAVAEPDVAAGVVAVITPGQLVERVLDEAPELIGYGVRRTSSRWTNPPRSAAQVVELLVGHPTMAAVKRRTRPLVTYRCQARQQLDQFGQLSTGSP